MAEIKAGIKNFGVGVGIDVEGIERFRNINAERHKLFLDKIFTKNELGYCLSRKDPSPHLAMKYAGKEAIVKALSSIGMGCISYKSLEIINRGGGTIYQKKEAPRVRINDKNFSSLNVQLSLSFCRNTAIAFATAMEIGNYG